MKLSSFLQMKPNVFICEKLGWRVALFYIMMLGKLYFFLKEEEKRKIIEAVEYVFGNMKEKQEVQELSRKVLKGIIAHYYEKFYNAYEDTSGLSSFMEKSIEAPSLDKLDRALSGGKGVLFVTGHYGGIEYIPIYLALKGYSVSVVMKFATQQLRETSYARADALGLRVVEANQNSRVLLTVVRELKKNRIVFIECDEIDEWKPSRKEKISFLGKIVGVDRTINLIHKRSGAEVVLGLLHRHSFKRYALMIEDYNDMLKRLGGRASSVGQAIIKCFEQYVYEGPEQWYQWKKYAGLGGVQDPAFLHEENKSPSLLRPACVARA